MTIQELKPILITLLGESSRISWNEATDQAAAEIMKLMPKWVSVSERLPELPAPYYDESWGGMVRPVTIRVMVYDGEDVYEESVGEEGFTYKSITHWMPLPQKPSQTKANG